MTHFRSGASVFRVRRRSGRAPHSRRDDPAREELHGRGPCTATHERRKDTAASGYGTQRVRVGRDAIKDFDCCCLSLQPCRDPVVT
ncbi:nitric oxide synthase-interacting protein [Manacus candei]|uniref:nitric oxide synthase-interacting protein n=1 Tax=Manacus candei TaxID=415023 RepID=UPI0022269D67|nr:nitric oxide synthase-interacting protein [Manacus candei]